MSFYRNRYINKINTSSVKLQHVCVSRSTIMDIMVTMSDVPAPMTMGLRRLVLSEMTPNTMELQAAANSMGSSMMATHVAAVQQLGRYTMSWSQYSKNLQPGHREIDDNISHGVKPGHRKIYENRSRGIKSGHRETQTPRSGYFPWSVQ